MELPKLPAIKDLVPYLIVAMVTFGGSMWARLGERDLSCDKRVEQAEKQGREWQKILQDKLDRQEAKIDSAYAKIERISAEQTETYKRYFEMLAKIKRK